jgi:hypothetical protein
LPIPSLWRNIASQRHRGGEKIRGRQEDLLLLGTKDAQHEVVAVAELPVLDSAGGVKKNTKGYKRCSSIWKTRSFLEQTWFSHRNRYRKYTGLK